MAVNNFTGKNIQDTYQRVVQTDGTKVYNGTGSLLPISFNGKISSNGKCEIPIKKLKGLIDEDTIGNIRLEIIAEDTFFTPWESEFEVDASKKVQVEVKSQKNKPILETKVNVKVKNSKSITITEKQHVLNLFKILVKEDITFKNISFKRNKLNNIVATYLKENTIKNQEKVINGVLKVLEKKE